MSIWLCCGTTWGSGKLNCSLMSHRPPLQFSACSYPPRPYLACILTFGRAVIVFLYFLIKHAGLLQLLFGKICCRLIRTQITDSGILTLLTSSSLRLLAATPVLASCPSDVRDWFHWYSFLAVRISTVVAQSYSAITDLSSRVQRSVGPDEFF